MNSMNQEFRLKKNVTQNYLSCWDYFDLNYKIITITKTYRRMREGQCQIVNYFCIRVCPKEGRR